MSNKVKIAVDVMGGENSPKKIIDGIGIALKNDKEIFFNLYGKRWFSMVWGPFVHY